MQWFLVIVQLDAQILFDVFIYLFIVLYMFRAEAVLIQFVSPGDEDDMLETCREL